MRYIESDFDKKRFHITGIIDFSCPHIAGFDLFCDALFAAILLDGIVDCINLFDTSNRKFVDINFYFKKFNDEWNEEELSEIESVEWDKNYQLEFCKFFGLDDNGNLPPG